MKAKTKAKTRAPAAPVLVRTIKSKAGKMEILKGSDGFTWHVTARNGYKVSGGRGLNSAHSCLKGAKATGRILYDLLNSMNL